MAKVAYIPYNEDLDTIFGLLKISISTKDFGGVRGWDPKEFNDALADAWDALFELDEFEFDGQPGDDWDAAEALLHGHYAVAYWSTESGHMPE